MPWGYAAVAVGTLGAAYMNSKSSKSAADTQANAAQSAAQAQMNMFNQIQQNLQPYMQAGQQAINPMISAMGYTVDANGNMVANPNSPLNQQFSFNAQDLENTPGYQFALQQGLRGVNQSAAAKGLGVSGANIKGTLDYATGLADQTYGNQFARAMQQYQTNYNSAANNAARLAGLVQMGQNSAANIGTQGMSAAQNAGNYLTSGANAQAAGQIGSTNAYSNAISGLGNEYLQYKMINNASTPSS